MLRVSFVLGKGSVYENESNTKEFDISDGSDLK